MTRSATRQAKGPSEFACPLASGAASSIILMKIKFLSLSLLAAACICSPALQAGTPEQEKAFVDKYKTAYEAGDKATLESFLYTKGAIPMALEFYKMMLTEGAGGKITTIELVNLSPEDAKKADADEIQEGPGGQKWKLPLKPTKKLKITVEKKDANGSSSSSSESFIAEEGGKYVIPVPAPVK